VTVAVVVSVPASAAVAATSATAAIPMMMKIRCRMMIVSPVRSEGVLAWQTHYRVAG
jgi:hypothetical protein